jgi:hypothetical protein
MINYKFESCEGNSATTLTAAAAEDENLKKKKKKKNDTKTPSPTSFMTCLHSRLGFAAGPPFRRSTSRHESEREERYRKEIATEANTGMYAMTEEWRAQEEENEVEKEREKREERIPQGS